MIVTGLPEAATADLKLPSNRSAWLTVGWPLVIFAVLVCVRMPAIITTGRFWAEEGTVFFHNAWFLPPMQALFTSFGGYLNLLANASPLAARLIMPLSLAPYLTILISLLIQLCPPFLLLTAQDVWLRPRHVRFAAVMLLLLVPTSEELWLQTLHCQFHLTLCCAIILSLETTTGRIAMCRLMLLAMAPLCGPTAIALLPLFLLRTIIERSPGRFLQTSVLGAGAAIQLLLFFHAVPGRGYTLDPVVLLCVLTVRHLEVPFLGEAHANVVAALIRARRAAGYVPLRATLLPIMAFGGLAAVVLWHRSARPSRWFLCAAGLIAAGSYFGAIGGAATLIDAHYGERYSYVPQALLALSVMALAATTRRWTAGVAWVAVIWLLVIGGWEYLHPWPIISHGPSWRNEVALWRADPAHALKIWPAGWSVTLDPAQP